MNERDIKRALGWMAHVKSEVAAMRNFPGSAEAPRRRLEKLASKVEHSMRTKLARLKEADRG